MKNTLIVIALILGFVGMVVFANMVLKNYSFYFEEEKMNSGEEYVKENSNRNDEMVNNEENIIKEEEKQMEIITLTSENFEKEVLKSEKTVLVDFYADWCGPCKMMSPIVEKIANESTDLKVGKVNIDEEETLAIQYGVMSIPTFIVVKNGEVVNKVVGAVSKSELENLIK